VAINLGWVPIPITVSLAAGGDFVAVLQSSASWPAGSGVSLKFVGTSTTTWTAAISGATATFEKTATQVNTLIATDQRTVELHYTEADGSDLLWGRGGVQVV
jgi:hypothetical protein